MERKEFLKKAGVGSVALASLPVLADVASAADDVGGPKRKFYFTALSGVAPTLTGGEAIAMAGCGRWGHLGVVGGGEFVHFDGATIPSPSFIATGSWGALEVLDFVETGTWGRGVSGILTLRVHLTPCDGPIIRGATLKIVCNLGPAGISTGETEGYELSLPGGPTFKQFSPNIGLTLFTQNCGRVVSPEDD